MFLFCPFLGYFCYFWVRRGTALVLNYFVVYGVCVAFFLFLNWDKVLLYIPRIALNSQCSLGWPPPTSVLVLQMCATTLNLVCVFWEKLVIKILRMTLLWSYCILPDKIKTVLSTGRMTSGFTNCLFFVSSQFKFENTSRHSEHGFEGRNLTD